MSKHDEQDFVTCPYNPVHRMLRKRLQRHLMKCSINYPNILLQKCPFNSTHMIMEQEFVQHVTNCPDRKLLDQYKIDPPVKEEERMQQPEIECADNWDNDADAVDYNPQKYAETANIIRQPVGEQPAERKQFIKQERKRQGIKDVDEDDEDVKIITLPQRTFIKEIKYGATIDARHMGTTTTTKRAAKRRLAAQNDRPATPPPPQISNWNLNNMEPQQLRNTADKDYSGRNASPPPLMVNNVKTFSYSFGAQNNRARSRSPTISSNGNAASRAQGAVPRNKRACNRWDVDNMSPERF